MKRISILMILILLLTLGCAPKNSMESGDPNVSKAEPSTELQIQEEPRNVSIPSLYNEGENESVEKEDSVSDQVQNNDQAGSSSMWARE
ncbi:MAG: hypothetical protein HYY61_01255 [Deltaproteobacteria bacterium]|nr:hypothetical protein [Deltaproteobacteria bacterium]